MWQIIKEFVLGDPITSRVPQPVWEAIAERQHRGEILIASTQLFIGCLWALLYTLAPKTFMDESAIAPVPVALTLYIVFAVSRLFLLHRGWRSKLLPTFSIFMDIAVLILLIWSFHLQYGQPAAFYLKAPTMVYLFIFIALRALRFSAAYVIIAGVVASAGWLILVAYAFYSSTDVQMGITRDYVTYLTSNKILLGAEFDKVITLLLTTGIIAIAIHRARSMLIMAVKESLAHDALDRFFDAKVAEKIVNADHALQPGEGEVREAAVLFCDIRGFTTLSKEMEPDQVMQVLGGYQQRMIEAAERHGGVIDKFLGDGILITFGAATPSETAAADALSAIIDMNTAALAWAESQRANDGPVLSVGFAADYGRLVFGAVGDADRLELTVIGDPVNRAAKFENANKQFATSALVTKSTYEIAINQGFAASPAYRIIENAKISGLTEAQDLLVLCEKSEI